MRDIQIPVRVSELEKKKIMENAEKANMRFSEYLRTQGINGCEQKGNPNLLCRIASMLQEVENQFRNEDDKEILRKAGKRLWEL
ncbi:MAG: hypothetical protein NC548_64590 [Lachnospiraceae bacterium]|nr:hypothetical protein [Lachnospiraceae bacterium]